jgi:hypothetical protein
MDDDHHDVLVDHRTNVLDDPNDLNSDVMMDGNLCLRMSDPLDDHSMGDGLMTVVSLCLRMNETDDRNDLKTDGNHVNRNYAPRDLMMDANLDAMSHRVMLMDDLNMSCDRMSHDHLRCDHRMMHHRDTNRMDGMNLDGKMKFHHDCRPKKVDRTHLNRESHLMMVCLMKI